MNGKVRRMAARFESLAVDAKATTYNYLRRGRINSIESKNGSDDINQAKKSPHQGAPQELDENAIGREQTLAVPGTYESTPVPSWVYEEDTHSPLRPHFSATSNTTSSPDPIPLLADIIARLRQPTSSEDPPSAISPLHLPTAINPFSPTSPPTYHEEEAEPLPPTPHPSFAAISRIITLYTHHRRTQTCPSPSFFALYHFLRHHSGALTPAFRDARGYSVYYNRYTQHVDATGSESANMWAVRGNPEHEGMVRRWMEVQRRAREERVRRGVDLIEVLVEEGRGTWIGPGRDERGGLRRRGVELGRLVIPDGEEGGKVGEMSGDTQYCSAPADLGLFSTDVPEGLRRVGRDSLAVDALDTAGSTDSASYYSEYEDDAEEVELWSKVHRLAEMNSCPSPSLFGLYAWLRHFPLDQARILAQDYEDYLDRWRANRNINSGWSGLRWVLWRNPERLEAQRRWHNDKKILRARMRQRGEQLPESHIGPKADPRGRMPRKVQLGKLQIPMNSLEY